MSSKSDFWTEERVNRLEKVLQHERGDAQIQAFLRRLANAQDLEQRRNLIMHDLLPVLQHGQAVQLWEGKVIPTRLALRDIVEDFLYRDGVAENIPTNEPDTPEEAAERERLAQLFSQGKPASEIVIDDRGPR
jgi:hypothetical protein